MSTTVILIADGIVAILFIIWVTLIILDSRMYEDRIKEQQRKKKVLEAQKKKQEIILRKKGYPFE